MKLSSLRIIPPIERYNWLVQLAQTIPGKLILLFVFALELLLHDKQWWIESILILAVMTFIPKKRRLLLLLSTVYWLFNYTNFDWRGITSAIEQFQLTLPMDDPFFQAGFISTAILFCAVFHFLAVKYNHTIIMRRPVLSLFIVYFTIVLSASYLPLPPIYTAFIWIFIFTFGHYLWFLAYSLLDRKNAQHDGFVWQFRTYIPFWMEQSPMLLPIPKGAAYLRRIEAKTPESLAICQLKAIKLLLWAFLLIIVRAVFDKVMYGFTIVIPIQLPELQSLELPTFHMAFHGAVDGNYYPWYQSWFSLLTELFNRVLTLAITGHIIIAYVRMAGFNALRSTYKPLGAPTIAEFWNRYFYYFKELLVELFFYPTFSRYFKQHPRFRLFFATLMAAGFGNVLFHFIYRPIYIIELGFVDAIISFHVYMFYGMILGTAIGISQIRNRHRKIPRPWWREKIVAPAIVILFYCFVLIFDDPDRTLTLKDNFIFVLSLFGIYR